MLTDRSIPTLELPNFRLVVVGPQPARRIAPTTHTRIWKARVVVDTWNRPLYRPTPPWLSGR